MGFGKDKPGKVEATVSPFKGKTQYQIASMLNDRFDESRKTMYAGLEGLFTDSADCSTGKADQMQCTGKGSKTDSEEIYFEVAGTEG